MGPDDHADRAAAPPAELAAVDQLAWRREYNIRQREADWKVRQEEWLSQKRVVWEIERCERESRIACARENRRKEELEARVAQRHFEVDCRYKERCRTGEIQKRDQAWEQQENERLVEMNRTAREEKEAREAARLDEKAARCRELREAACDKAEKLRRAAELEQRRQENIRKREEERNKKASEEARRLKSDALAQSHALVSQFTDKTVPREPTLVSILTQRRDSHQSNPAPDPSIV